MGALNSGSHTRAALALSLLLLASRCHAQAPTAAWEGVVDDAASKPLGGARIELSTAGRKFSVISGPDGHFAFPNIADGIYQLTVELNGHSLPYAQPLHLTEPRTKALLTISKQSALSVQTLESATAKNGGEELSSTAVSQIPLNKRDFSQLLLLAAGTMTDSSSSTNFTQQFAINGQRGVEAVFAMDGADTSDPEMGGATFANLPRLDVERRGSRTC